MDVENPNEDISPYHAVFGERTRLARYGKLTDELHHSYSSIAGVPVPPTPSLGDVVQSVVLDSYLKKSQGPGTILDMEEEQARQTSIPRTPER